MKRIVVAVLACLQIVAVWGAPIDFSVSAIPDSLKENAFGVIRYSYTGFDYKSERLGVERQSYAVTVFSKLGQDMANFLTYGDKFRELKKFSAVLYNGKGEVLRKFKMSDIQTTEISEGLASDLKYYFFRCETPIFPFTIAYEYEVNWKDGIFSFPIFFPQSRYSAALEMARYELNLPEGLKIRCKSLNNGDCEPAVFRRKGMVSYVWQLENRKAIEPENFAPAVKKLAPMIYVSPEYFVYDKVTGVITDWNSYGSWVYGLLNGRGELSAEFKNRIIRLTEGAGSDREKVKILYDYLEQTTRYVSIQLGIGGFQPMAASEVNKTGFGDCKALSFYLKSMLEVVGISSNYVEIRSDERNKRMFSDYATFYETNHVILQVPLEGDTLWLECTNPRLPFGFVHNNIAGHDAIEIKSGGGRFCQLPDYPDSLSVYKNKAEVGLRADGSATVRSGKEFHVKVYSDYFGFNLQKNNEQTDWLRRRIELPNVRVQSVAVREDKMPLPVMYIDYTWDTNLYGSKTGNRLFVPINPFRSPHDWFRKKERVYDIDLWKGRYDVDSILIALPEEYEVEFLPESIVLDSKYGRFSSHVSVSEGMMMVSQSFYLPVGMYEVSEYGALKDFIDQVNRAYEKKIILKKQGLHKK